MTRYGILWVLLLVMIEAGCATVTDGWRQKISIESFPPGAQVYVDGQPRGETPLVTKVSRRKTHEIRLHLDGYEEESVVTEKESNGTVTGNGLYGGLLGIAIDYMTGAAYEVFPDRIMYALEPIEKEGQQGNAGTEGGASRPARRPEDEAVE